jgi:hypothetical protein
VTTATAPGPAPLTPRGYLDAVALCTRYIKRLHPSPYPASPDALPDAASAVYIATDAHGIVRYVGSTKRASTTHTVSARPVSALRARLAEHLRHRQLAYRWAQLWVIELQDDLPIGTVRWVEGHVARALGPKDNARIPRPVCNRP